MKDKRKVELRSPITTQDIFVIMVERFVKSEDFEPYMMEDIMKMHQLVLEAKEQ
jgi:hypothetical protein